MVIVGALNVGSIQLHFDTKVHTNVKFPSRPNKLGSVRSYTRIEGEDNQNVKDWVERGLDIVRGMEMGMFKLGSTVVLIFEG